MALFVVGDRRNTGFCIKCGTELIIPWNDFQCCPKCTEELTYHVKVAKKKKGKNRRVKKDVLISNTIMR